MSHQQNDPPKIWYVAYMHQTIWVEVGVRRNLCV